MKIYKHLYSLLQIFFSLLGIFTINLCLLSPLHAQQFNHYIPEGMHPSEMPFIEAKTSLNMDYKTALQNEDTAQMIKSLLLLSTMERINLDYGAAFNHSGEALFLAEEAMDTLLMAKAHEEMGALNYLFKQDKQADIHFSKSLEHYKISQKKSLVSSRELYRPYYNMVLFYQRILDSSSTQKYIDSCITIADTTHLQELTNVYLNQKKAHELYRQELYNKSNELLHKCVNAFEALKAGSKEAQIHQSYLIVVYWAIANNYRALRNRDLAIQYYEKSLQQKDLYGEHTFFKTFVYARYASLLYQQGKYQKSYDNLLLAKTINDKYLNPRNDSTQNFLGIKDRYAEELQNKKEELHVKNLELAKNKQEILRFRIVFFIAAFVIIILLLILRTRSQHLKHKKENEENEQKQQESKETIDLKNKELTTSILQLIEKEEIIKTMSAQLAKDPTNKSLLASVENRSLSLWDAFNTRFVALNADFYERLKTRVPDLSAADLKICALIKLNFSGKEMAYLLGISEGSVNVARHRLRKKINIDREVNLVQYINSI